MNIFLAALVLVGGATNTPRVLSHGRALRLRHGSCHLQNQPRWYTRPLPLPSLPGDCRGRPVCDTKLPVRNRQPACFKAPGRISVAFLAFLAGVVLDVSAARFSVAIKPALRAAATFFEGGGITAAGLNALHRGLRLLRSVLLRSLKMWTAK